jgi:tetratricopeptide (TPR) repeat protein
MSNPIRTMLAVAGDLVGVCVLGAMVLAAPSPAAAQEATATAPAVTGPAIEVNDVMLAIPGVQRGMTRQELLDVASKAIDDMNWKHGETLLFEIIKQDANAIGALGLLGALYERWAAELRNDTGNPRAEQDLKKVEANAVAVYLRAGPKMRERGRLGTAESMYRRVLEYEPKNPKALLELARILAETNRTMLATERYRQYIASAGERDADAHIELGRVYKRAGARRQAIEAFEKAQSLVPESPEPANELAFVHLESGQPTEALTAANTAVSKGLGNPKYYNTRALVHLARDDAASAANDAKRAVELARNWAQADPRDQERVSAVANYLHTFIEARQRTLAGPEGDVNQRIELADAMRELAGVDQLLAHHQLVKLLEGADEASRDNVRLLERLADAQLMVHRTEDAAATCRRILKIEPGNVVGKQVLEAATSAGAGTPGQADAKAP